MNILLINHYAGSPAMGMEYRPYYFSREWQKEGHKTIIVAASNSHVRTNQPKVEKDLQTEIIDGVEYLWIKTPQYKGNGIGRIINMLIFVFKLLVYSKRISRICSFNAVIASSTYPLDIFPSKKIARKSKTKLIFEVHDLWPLSPIELGGYSKWHPFIMIMQWAENFAYKHSDKIVSMLPKAKEHMVSHGMKAEKFNYIPNGININDWKDKKNIPAEHKQLLQREQEKGNFLICYAGTYGLANALDTYIDAAEQLIQHRITFILVGQGPEKENLKRKVESRNLKNVLFLPPVNKNMIPDLLSYMDILYLGLQNQSLFRFGISPNKLFDYMMAGKPIIQAINAGNDMVTEAECGISIESNNSKALSENIQKICLLSESDRKKIGENGTKYVLENHTYDILQKRFLSILS